MNRRSLLKLFSVLPATKVNSKLVIKQGGSAVMDGIGVFRGGVLVSRLGFLPITCYVGDKISFKYDLSIVGKGEE